MVSVDGIFTVGRLTINAGDSVGVNNGGALIIANNGSFPGTGSIVNNGDLSLNSTGNTTILQLLRLA